MSKTSTRVPFGPSGNTSRSVSTSPDLLRAILADVGPAAQQDWKIGCTLYDPFYGVRAQLVGCGASPDHGELVVFFEIQGQAGCVPFIPNEQLGIRWHVLDTSTSSKLLPPGGMFTVPTDARNFFTAPRLTSFGPAIDTSVFVVAALGLTAGTLIEEADGKGDRFLFVGLKKRQNGGVAVEVVAERVATGELVELPPGAQFRVCVPPAANRFVTYHTVDEDREHHPVNCNFPLRFGKTGEAVSYLDVDPVRCRHYFGLTSGQRVVEMEQKKEVTVLGINRPANGPLQLLFQPKDWKGAGQFPNNTELKVVSMAAHVPFFQRPPWSPKLGLPAGDARGREIVIPEFSRKDIAPEVGDCNFRYLCRSGALLKVNREALKLMGLCHGQRLIDDDGEPLTALGLAAISANGRVAKNYDSVDDGDEVLCWFVRDVDRRAMAMRTGHKLTAYDGIAPEVLSPHSGRQIVYNKQPVMTDSEDGDPDMIPVFTKLYSTGTVQTSGDLVDMNAERCEYYFGVVPGQRIDGCSTVIGLRRTKEHDKHGRPLVGLWSHVDNLNGAGTWEDGTKLFVQDECVSADLITKREFLECKTPDVIESDPLRQTFPYPRGVGNAEIALFDVDPTRNARYCGASAVPGRRCGGFCTYIGMAMDDGKVKMWFHVDGSPGAGLFSEGHLIECNDYIFPINTLHAMSNIASNSNQQQEDAVVSQFVDVGPITESKQFPLEHSFLYWDGMKNPELSWFDCRKEVCQHYFGVTPGEVLRHGKKRLLMVVGLRIAGPKKVGLFLHEDNHAGASTFNNSGGLFLRKTNIVRSLPELHVPDGVTTVPHPFPTGELTPTRQPSIGNHDHDSLNFNFCVRAQSGQLMKVDTEWGAQHGFRHGVQCVVGGALVHYVGVGEEDRGRLFFQRNGSHRVGRFDEKDVVYMAKDSPLVTIVEETATPLTFRTRKPNPSCPPQFDTFYPMGLSMSRPTKLERIDNNPERCRFYFSLVPGTVVYPNGKLGPGSTAVGMQMVGDELNMFFQPDGSPGAGKFEDNTELDVSAERRMLKGYQGPMVQHLNDSQSPTKKTSTPTKTGTTPTPYQPPTVSSAANDANEHQLIRQETVTNAGGGSNLLVTYALQYVTDVASEDPAKAAAAEHSVLQQLEMEGFGGDNTHGPHSTEDLLQSIQQFITHEAPIGAWFPATKSVGDGKGKKKSVLCSMVEDTKMRNLFETSHGCGNVNQDVRRNWEERMFGSIYTGCAPTDRVKYGLLNAFNDPFGPQVPGSQYGEAFMVFRRLRDRITITPKDSLGNKCAVATMGMAAPSSPLGSPNTNTAASASSGASSFTMLLSEFQGQFGDGAQVEHDSKRELRTLAQIVSGQVPWAATAGLFYKEIQVHGPVHLQDHVSHIVVPAESLTADPKLLSNLVRFCTKNGAWLVTTTTTRNLANLRLASKKEIVDHIRMHFPGVLDNDDDQRNDEVISALAAGSEFDCLVAGPQTDETRQLYRALVTLYCIHDWRHLRQLSAHIAADDAATSDEDDEDEGDKKKKKEGDGESSGGGDGEKEKEKFMALMKMLAAAAESS